MSDLEVVDRDPAVDRNSHVLFLPILALSVVLVEVGKRQDAENCDLESATSHVAGSF